MGSSFSVLDGSGLNPVEAVHCLVHPGFDAGEYPDFEKNVLSYIDYVGQRTNDVLLIISDGESYDESQLQKWRMLETIEDIAVYLSCANDIVKNNTPLSEYGKRYGKFFSREGRDKRFLTWCIENIDLTAITQLEQEWEDLKTKYDSGAFNNCMNIHDDQARILNEKGLKIRSGFDVLGLAQKAVLDLSIHLNSQGNTYRNVRNKGRFFRFLQHAHRRIGSKRVSELFIADEEKPYLVKILPVTHYRMPDGQRVSTNHELVRGRFTPIGSTFNQSEPDKYGNAASEYDELTCDLSVSRNRRLENRQVDLTLADMGFRITLDTQFHFFGEYRDRCVESVAMVVKARLEGIAGEDFHIAGDDLTLEKDEDRILRLQALQIK